MCGKFTAMASWPDVVDFSQALTGAVMAVAMVTAATAS